MMVRTEIGPYKIEEKLGDGGFSTVFRAHDSNLHKTVAIKVLEAREGRGFDREAFENERKAIGPISEHPQIVNVYYSGWTDDGLPYIVMQYYESGTLLDRIRTGPYPVEYTLRIGVRIAEALHHAHEADVLHRDVKPANILFGESSVALADFGIAQIATGQSVVEGLTLQYAAPEVIRGEPSSIRSDVYSLGATLYTALDGRRPFSVPDRNGEAEVRERILHQEPPRIRNQTVPPMLENYLHLMMAKDPLARPGSAAEVTSKLREFQAALDLKELNEDGDFTVTRLARLDPADVEMPVSGLDLLDQQHRNPAGDASVPISESRPAVPSGDQTSTIARPLRPEHQLSNALGAPAVQPVKEVESDRRPSRAVDTRGRAGLALVAVVGLVLAAGLSLAVASWLSGPSPDDDVTLPAAPSSTVVIRPAVALGAPAEVRLERGDDDRLLVKWDPVPSAERYRVAVLQGEVFDVTEVRAEIDSVAAPPNRTVCVEVIAIAASGSASPASEPTCIGP